MNDNLSQQLDEIVHYLNPYWNFRLDTNLRPLYRFPTFVRLMFKFPKLFNVVDDSWSGKTSELERRYLDAFCTEKEKGTEVFQAFQADYPLERIASNLYAAFPEVNFDKIKKLHDSKIAERFNFSLAQVFAFILAGSSLVLKTVPKKIIETYIGMTTDDFEVVVFWYTLAAIAYACVSLIPAYWKTKQSLLKHKFVTRILDYCSLRYSQSNAKTLSSSPRTSSEG